MTQCNFKRKTCLRIGVYKFGEISPKKKKLNVFINGSFNIKGAAQQFRVPLVIPIKVLNCFMGSAYLARQMECFVALLDLTHVSIW